MVNISSPLPKLPNIQGGLQNNYSQTNLPIPIPSSSSTMSSGGLGALLGSIASPLTGGIGAAVGALGNLIGDAINYKRQQKTYDKQRADALADYEMQRTDYLSDLANERAYNSPLAQVQRLKAAGINPNEVFGSTVDNVTNTATNQASVRGASASPPPSGSGLGSAMIQGASGLIQSSLAGVQSQQMAQDIALKKAQAINVLSDSRLTASKEIRQKIENSFLDSLFAADIAEKQARTNQLIDSLETASLARLSSSYDLYNLKPAQKSQIEAAIAQYYANVRSINQQNAYFDSVKSVRQRNEIIDMKRNSYQMAEDHFKRDIIKAIDLKNADNIAERLRNDLLEGTFMFKYLWSFK